MQDRPTTVELIQAVREFLAGEVVPAIADRSLRYRMRIALHALGIVEREVPDEERRLRAEGEALVGLLDLPPTAAPADSRLLRAWVLEANRVLCERIRGGAADGGPWRTRVVAHLQRVVEEKLQGSNPERLDLFRAGSSSGR
jgi:hypothetical protein